MAAQLPLVPDVATTARDVLLVAIVLPLLVQWWSTYYPEAEPGGGGWVVQRMVSSPGTGKTAFLKQTLSRLAARGEACAAVVGDLAARRSSGNEATGGAWCSGSTDRIRGRASARPPTGSPSARSAGRHPASHCPSGFGRPILT